MTHIVSDYAALAELVSGSVRLPPGRYRARSRTWLMWCEGTSSRIYGTTEGRVLVQGHDGYSANSKLMAAPLWAEGEFTLYRDGFVDVQDWITSAAGNAWMRGLGNEDNVPAALELWRLCP